MLSLTLQAGKKINLSNLLSCCSNSCYFIQCCILPSSRHAKGGGVTTAHRELLSPHTITPMSPESSTSRLTTLAVLLAPPALVLAVPAWKVPHL